MDVEKLIKLLRYCATTYTMYDCSKCVRDNNGQCDEELMSQAADALEKLQSELNAAKSPEVLEAVDELMEFARTRMGIAEWLYYVDVLGEWRGQEEDWP